MNTSPKGAIIYSSRYGATRQYAEWLAEELKWPLLDAMETTAEDLTLYETLIIGSSVYMGKLLLKGWIKYNNPRLSDKETFFFIVCGTPVSEKERLDLIARNNLPHDLLCPHNVFFLPGRVIISKLGWKDRLTIKLGAKLQKDPVIKKRMLEDMDNVRKEHLLPLLEQVAEPIEAH